MSFRLALLSLVRSPQRTALSAALLALCTAGLIINSGLVSFIFNGLRDDAIFGRFGHIQLYRTGYLKNHKLWPDRYLLSEDEYERIKTRLGRLSSVKAVTAETNLAVFMVSGSHSAAGIAHCVPSSSSGFFPGTRLVAGEDRLEDHDSFEDASIGRGLADKLGVRVGDILSLTTSSAVGYNGMDVRIAGIFEEGFRDYDDWSIKLPLSSVHKLMGQGNVERVIVLLDEGANVTSARQQILDRLHREGIDVEATAWWDLAEFYNQVVAMFGKELLVIRWITQGIAGVGIVISIAMAFSERRKEMATLMALGMTRVRLFFLFVQESFWLGLLGAFLGALAGAGLGYLISAIGIRMPPPPGSTRPFVARVEFLPGNLIHYAFLTLGVTMIAGLAPALWILRMKIAQALRPADG